MRTGDEEYRKEGGRGETRRVGEGVGEGREGAYVHLKTMKSFLACCSVSTILSMMLKSAHLVALNGAQLLHLKCNFGSLRCLSWHVYCVNLIT